MDSLSGQKLPTLGLLLVYMSRGRAQRKKTDGVAAEAARARAGGEQQGRPAPVVGRRKDQKRPCRDRSGRGQRKKKEGQRKSRSAAASSRTAVPRPPPAAPSLAARVQRPAAGRATAGSSQATVASTGLVGDSARSEQHLREVGAATA